MKAFSLLTMAAAAVFAGAALAQETPPPAAEPAPTPEAAAPATLFPDTAPSDPPPAASRRGGNRRGRKGGRGRNSPYGAESAARRANADPLEVRIAFRKAKTRALLDPALADLVVQSDQAPTDEAKRAFLRAYYTRLYAAVQRIDRSAAMKAHVELLAKASEQRYDPKRRAYNDDDDPNGNGRGRR